MAEIDLLEKETPEEAEVRSELFDPLQFEQAPISEEDQKQIDMINGSRDRETEVLENAGRLVPDNLAPPQEGQAVSDSQIKSDIALEEFNRVNGFPREGSDPNPKERLIGRIQKDVASGNVLYEGFVNAYAGIFSGAANVAISFQDAIDSILETATGNPDFEFKTITDITNTVKNNFNHRAETTDNATNNFIFHTTQYFAQYAISARLFRGVIGTPRFEKMSQLKRQLGTDFITGLLGNPDDDSLLKTVTHMNFMDEFMGGAISDFFSNFEDTRAERRLGNAFSEAGFGFALTKVLIPAIKATYSLLADTVQKALPQRAKDLFQPEDVLPKDRVDTVEGLARIEAENTRILDDLKVEKDPAVRQSLEEVGRELTTEAKRQRKRMGLDPLAKNETILDVQSDREFGTFKVEGDNLFEAKGSKTTSPGVVRLPINAKGAPLFKTEISILANQAARAPIRDSVTASKEAIERLYGKDSQGFTLKNTEGKDVNFRVSIEDIEGPGDVGRALTALEGHLHSVKPRINIPDTDAEAKKIIDEMSKEEGDNLAATAKRMGLDITQLNSRQVLSIDGVGMRANAQLTMALTKELVTLADNIAIKDLDKATRIEYEQVAGRLISSIEETTKLGKDMARVAAQSLRLVPRLQDSSTRKILNIIMNPEVRFSDQMAGVYNAAYGKNGVAKTLHAIRTMGSPEEISGFLSKQLTKGVASEGAYQNILVENYLGVGLLSGPSTAFANLAGGFGALFMKNVEMFYQAAFHKFFGLGVKGADPNFGDTMATIWGQITMFGNASKVAGRTVWTGHQAGFTRSKLGNALDNRALTPENLGLQGSDPAIMSAYRFMGSLNRGGANFLMGGDDFIRTIAMGGQVKLAARKQALAKFPGVQDTGQFRKYYEFLMKNPDRLKNYNEVRLEATKLGDEVTFTDKLSDSGIVASIDKAVNNVPILRLFVPFIKVLSNMNKFFFKRDPITGTLRAGANSIGIGRHFTEEFKDPKTAALRASQIASGVTMFGAAMLIGGMTGRLTGSRRKDYKAEANRKEINQPADSIGFETKTGDTYYVNYSRIEPFSKFLRVTADLTEILGHINHQDELPVDIFWQGFMSVQENFLNTTWMPGLGTLLDLMDGQNDPADIERAIAQILTSFTPAIGREIEKATSPAIKESKAGQVRLFTDKDEREPTFEKFVEKIFNVLPGFSDNGIDKIDRWGNTMFVGGDIRRRKGSAKLFDANLVSALAPFSVSHEKYDQTVDPEIDRLTIDMTDPPASIGISISEGLTIPGIKLSPKQYEQYRILSAKDLSRLVFLSNNSISPASIDRLKSDDVPSSLKQELSDLIQSRFYAEVPDTGFGSDDNKAALIKDIIYRHRAEARELLLLVVGNEGLTDEANRIYDVSLKTGGIQ